ncbi:carboxymuconolactone decarboxylase family protein [Achromobacter denitrificans]|uniref:carboxymuconolactone decarboxylase family protein n=1 Tax=Achromobacter denitrificans TaxID=32002 RepID=UPI0023E79E7D|nr:carboxymuconolactone decarboxylase family protein [Achromobacter denitrificans]MDF3857124.1 carboxymuconolactone decarboxylase family protein [Achromobacter denitrificans]MDF3942045.1 carboxymuconolactone decarboxylase family protein [Achromobacter denitrificans]
MSRVPLIDANITTPDRKALLEQIHGAFGATPNMFRAVANSPAALKSMWGAFGALGEGVIPAKLGEQIAVAVADRNGCEYCLAAHTALGRKAGASAEEMSAAQGGNAADPKTAAALRFALKLVEARGQIGDADVQAVRAAGFGDQEIVEILAHVALNLFTNYVNVAFAVPVDFPAVKLRRAA